MRAQVCLTENRDIPILQFLWRWKTATTAALAHRFFPHASSVVAYRRLWQLEKAKFIKAEVMRDGLKFYWTLDQKGFYAIRNLLPDLRELGFRSENLMHDHLASAVHLGEWLAAAPAGYETFTEQELRRFHVEHYPSWVPQDLTHRPDGYWSIPDRGHRRTVALEVEISHQKQSKYEAIGHYYERQRQVHRVLWVVETPSNAQRMRAALKGRFDSVDFHDFALVQDVQVKGWDAPLILGPEAGMTIHKLLGNRPTEPPQRSVGPLNFDFRKTTGIQRTSR